MPSLQPLLQPFARIALTEGATPIQRLARLESALATGVQIYVKRDDLQGLGGGGNKLRKLEFLLGEALAQQADTIVAVGGRQSNFARLTAAACARLGLACELMLGQSVPLDDLEYQRNGNVLLDSSAINQVTVKCCTLDRRPQPKKNRPMKVASRKNAIRPSMASGAPKMSPT